MKTTLLLTATLIITLACAQAQTISTPTASPEYPTVRSIDWGVVPYDRDDYQSADWREVRDQVCSADTLFYTGAKNTGCEADHVLSVSEAHHRGAHRFSDERKRSFYTDTRNLVPSDPAVNRTKSNHTPTQVSASPDHAWDAPGNDCAYVEIWLDTIVRYGLDITRAERNNALDFLSGCPGE